MLLATILLLCPFPQIAGTAKIITGDAAVASDVASDSTNDSLSHSLPSAPEAKVKSDTERVASAGAIEPNYTSVQPATQPVARLVGVKMSISRPYETATQRRLWYALSFTGSGAAAFDAWSTRRAISGGYGTESNPILRPFSHSRAMYAATQVSPLVMDFVGKRMMTSQHKWVRKMWWLPQSAGSGLSLYAGVHNTRLVHE